MKKFTLSVLLAATLVSASDFNYEVSPMAGYLWNANSDKDVCATGGIQDHAIYGLEAQFNILEFAGIKPEVALFYGQDQLTGRPESHIWTGMVSGVYEIDTNTLLTPFVKAGLGYEAERTALPSGYNGFLVDAGVGTKIDITKYIALKLEGLYMYKKNDGGENASNGHVHNIAALAGLTFNFDEKKAPVYAAVAPVAAAVVAEEPKPTPVIAAPVVAEVCPIDSDNDGVFDPQDKCPNTPAGFKVDGEGCPLTATLYVNFATDSNSVDEAGVDKISEFATFMKESPAYKASIVGHTDSTGSTAYNQKLSEKRAATVKNILVKDGVEAKRLTTSGKGEMYPVSSNKTTQGRTENRRIEVELSH